MSHRAHTCEISISDREWGCEPWVSWRSLCQTLSPPAQTLLACAREGELPSPASSRTLRTFHLTGSSSLPAAGGQGGTELFRARAAFSQHRELQHLSTGTDRLHSLFAPSCSSFSGSCHCQTASHGKKGPKSQDSGLTVTLGAEEEDCKMCTITSTRHTERFSLLCEAQIVSDLCLRAELAQNDPNSLQNSGFHGDMCNGGRSGSGIRSALPVCG